MLQLKTKNIALNPVGRAVAKKKLHSAMLDARIHILMLDEGADAIDILMPIKDGIYVMARSYELLNKTDSVEFRKLKSAMRILEECSANRFIWRQSYAITMNNAIELCVTEWSKIPPHTFHLAIVDVLGTM